MGLAMQSPVLTPWITAAEHSYPLGQGEMQPGWSSQAASRFGGDAVAQPPHPIIIAMKSTAIEACMMTESVVW